MAVLSIAGFLPNIGLPSVPGGQILLLRESLGKTTVLVMVHSARRVACHEYVQGLARIASEFEAWDGRLVVVVPGAPPEAAALQVGFGKIVADPHCALAQSASAAVIVADRYGQIFDAAYSSGSHALPSPHELAEWLKYLGTLCPE